MLELTDPKIFYMKFDLDLIQFSNDPFSETEKGFGEGPTHWRKCHVCNNWHHDRHTNKHVKVGQYSAWTRGVRYPIWFNSIFEFYQKNIHSMFESILLYPRLNSKYYSIQKNSADSIQKIIQFNSQGIVDTCRKEKNAP